MIRSVALALVVLHTSAWAQGLDPAPPSYRVSLSAGAAVRDSTYDDKQIPLHFGGFAPLTLHLGGAYFFLPWLGAALDGSFETFTIRGNDLVNTDPARPVSKQLLGFRLLGELTGRWSPLHWLGLELHLGYGGGTWPNMALDEKGAVTPAAAGWHGPSFGFAVAFEPDALFGGQLFGRVNPALSGSVLKPLSLSAGLQLFIGNFALASTRVAFLLEFEVIGVRGSAEPSTTFSQLQLRLGLGLRLRQQPPEPEGGTVAPKTGNGRLRGRAVVGGIGLAGVSITAGTLPLQKTGPDGDFEYADVKPGPYLVRAVAEGYKPLEQRVEVPPGDEAVVTLSLLKPSGPGKIRGVVKGEKEQPLAAAEVALEGKPPVTTASDGSYTLDGAGPGPVKVTVKAKGYKDGEDAAQVPPEGVATLDFTLVRQGERQLATIRGLVVRASNGKPVRATVKISDVNLTVPVKGDGRFVVQVPGGKYTLTIEAAGYVSQVKTVEVADGDQAIFHCDLQPAGR